MKRGRTSPGRAWRVAAGIVLVLALLAPGRAGVAQSAPPFQGTPLELEAYRLYNENRLITARARAEAVLRQDPESIVGHYVLGCALREAEGSLPRAMWHLGHAREVYETRWGTQRPPGAPWQLHREILFAIQALAGELEEYGYQLQVQEFYDSLYDPDLTAEHAWPLLHLRRFDEARRFAQAARQSADAWQQSLGLNALCAIEGEAHQRQAQYVACVAALEGARRRVTATAVPVEDPLNGPHVAVHAYNAALAALSALRYDEAERLALEGTHRLEFTTANPWRLLARLYADGGRMTDAIAALRQMQRWRIRQPARLRDQDRAETDVAVATVLLVAGEVDTALRLASRAIEQPDRRGLTATQPEQALGAHALLRRAIERTRAELAAEQASWQGTLARLASPWRRAGARLGTWGDEERVVDLLADDERIDATLRMYLRGGIEPLPTWLVGDLVPVLGAGVVGVVLRDVRREERAVAALGPFYDGLEAEVALAQGDGARALSLAQRSLAGLPAAEALLQARVAAVGAEAARREDRFAVSLGLYERALRRDPGVLRRMGLAVPAEVRVAATGPAAVRAGEVLARSPRLRVTPGGFQVAVEGAGPALRACLRSPMGALIACADAPPVRNEAPDDHAARLAQEFHRQVFAMRAGLSATDLQSLDGRNTVATQAAREQMHGVLDEITGEGR